MGNKKHIPLLWHALAVLLLCVVSCSKDVSDISNPEVIVVPDQSEVDVSARNRHLYSNLSGLSFEESTATRSSATGCETLESLLDRERTFSIKVNDDILTEIPFLDNFSSVGSNVSTSAIDSFNQDSVSVVNFSLLDWYHPAIEEHETFVITMIPFSDFGEYDVDASYTFLNNLDTFSGFLLFSSVDGAFISGYKYAEGSVEMSAVIEPSLLSSMVEPGFENSEAIVHVYFPAVTQTQTRTRVNKVQVSEEVVCLPPAIITAERDGGSDCCKSDRGESILQSLTELTESYTNGTSSGDRKGNGGGGAGSGKQKIGNGLPSNIKITSDVVDGVEAITKTLSELKKIEIISNLLDSLGSISITVVDSGSLGIAKAFAYSDGISIKATKNAGAALAEELFHLYQYQKDPAWQTGDREFEATVFDAVLQHDYGIKVGDDVLDELLEPIFIFYINPCKDNAKSVYTYLARQHYFENEGYPISSDISYPDKIKHIKQLTESK